MLIAEEHASRKDVPLFLFFPCFLSMFKLHDTVTFKRNNPIVWLLNSYDIWENILCYSFFTTYVLLLVE